MDGVLDSNFQLLDLSDCGLMYVADAIYLMLKEYDINKCNLRNNSLKNFPKKMVERFNKMIVFNIEGNQIKEIPSEISGWIYLKGLNISNNRIEQFPDVLYSLNELIFLDISDNSIQDLDVERLYTELTNLKTLHIRNNPISDETKAKLTKHEKKSKDLNISIE